MFNKLNSLHVLKSTIRSCFYSSFYLFLKGTLEINFFNMKFFLRSCPIFNKKRLYTLQLNCLFNINIYFFNYYSIILNQNIKQIF